MIELRRIELIAVPPNNWMELTAKSDTPFARGRAKGAPLSSAAHPGRSATRPDTIVPGCCLDVYMVG